MLKAISVGRGDGVDVKINDETVSRLHAELVPLGQNRFYLTDCVSSGGTFVGRGGQWVALTQDYVDAGEVILLGHYQTTPAQLVEYALGGKQAPDNGEPTGVGAGRKPMPQDQLPDGPVRRDAETGEIISLKD